MAVIPSAKVPRNSKGSTVSPYLILSHAILALFTFQIGVFFGSSMRRECPQIEIPKEAAPEPVTPKSKSKGFGKKIDQLIAGAALVDRSDFTKKYDVGVPWDLPKSGNEQALMLYSHPKSMPRNLQSDLSELPVFDDAEEASKNCQEMQVVLVRPNKSGQCVTIVGQWESFHVHHFMRLPVEGQKGEADLKYPMRYVSKHHQSNGRSPGLPSANAMTTGKYGKVIKDYLDRLPSILDRLKPLAQKAAGSDNTVIVMVCNFGQSELFFNFVCSARSRGMDLSKIILFATDDEIKALAEELGVAVFAVGDDFGEMPTKAANAYGDKVFAGMMMAKVYCVHLINMLGYDLLFQDVDVVWFKNPLEYLMDKEKSGDFDMYFQDDGARSSRYAPYSPNTGFYFVRHNARTEYVFSVFMRMGDLIQQSGSHQSALTSVISEHASWRGLKVKTFGRDDPAGKLFPGGFHYHNRKDFMREFIADKVQPYLFHMSWTHNKDNKQKFFQQMESWHVKAECVNTKVSDLPTKDVEAHCCLREPDFQCHYRDKPSKKPCKSSPPIDKGRPSFWK